ncbi:MAG: sugar phosphate isomerase/epimerase family protein, partial [Rhodospirillales bacterium]
HDAHLAGLRELGLDALEVAPSRRWPDTWKGLSSVAVNEYRHEIEDAGLKVVGLHSLLFDHPELQLFGDDNAVAQTLDFMVHLSGVCRDLGGKTLIWGGGRKRGNIPLDLAFERALTFMTKLVGRIADHGTCFCFEPLGPNDADFINRLEDAKRIVDAVDHTALRLQLDAKALVENNEATLKTFETAAPSLVHFHANEPGLGVLGTSGKIDHGALGSMLRSISYTGYVSAEQRMLNVEDPLADIAQSLRVLQSCYLNKPASEARP